MSTRLNVRPSRAWKEKIETSYQHLPVGVRQEASTLRTWISSKDTPTGCSRQNLNDLFFEPPTIQNRVLSYQDRGHSFWVPANACLLGVLDCTGIMGISQTSPPPGQGYFFEAPNLIGLETSGFAALEDPFESKVDSLHIPKHSMGLAIWDWQ